MNALSLLGFTILMALIPVAPFMIARWWRDVVDVYRAVDVLQREQRTGESLTQTAEALADDAHEWRGSEDDAIGCAGDIFDENEEPGLAAAVKRMKAEREAMGTTVPSGAALDVDSELAAFDQIKLMRAQPPPQNASGPALWPLIISELGDSETDRLVAADMQARHEFGVAKYGVPLVASNGRDHLADAYQEALDGVVYLRAACESGAPFRVHRCYVDVLDIAKELREVIAERDGR